MHTPLSSIPGGWNSSLVRQLCSPKILEHVLFTPLSFLSNKDRLVWIGSSSGKYAVKFGNELQFMVKKKSMSYLGGVRFYRFNINFLQDGEFGV